MSVQNFFRVKEDISINKVKKMKMEASITQQKGKKIPIQKQEAVDEGIKRLLTESHIEQIGEMKDDMFIQLRVKPVKKDRSVKIPFDARALNRAINKDKYQMPNQENLMEMAAKRLYNEDRIWYSSINLMYLYGQIPLHLLTAKQCNFQIFGGELSVFYSFCGLTVRPTEFQE